MAEPLEIMPRKAILRNAVILMVLCLGISALVLMNVERVMHRDLRIVTLAFAVLGILSFGYGLLYTLMRWKQPAPLFKCTDAGLEFHGSILLHGRVNWADIEGYELVQYGMGKRVLVKVKQPTRYIDKQMGITSRVMKMLYKRFGTPIAISANLFPDDIPTTLKLISQWKSNAL